MLRVRFRRLPALVGGCLLVGAVVLVGCNAFGGGEQRPETVDELLIDARIALTKGQAERAVRLLERAFEKDSSRVEVRVELADALLAVEGVNLFRLRSAISQLGGTLMNEPLREEQRSCVRSIGSGSSQYSVVTFEAEALTRLSQSSDRLVRAHELVVSRLLERRSDAFSNAHVQTRREAYALAALIYVAGKLKKLRESLQGTETMLLRSPVASPSLYVTCGKQEAQVEAALCNLAGGLIQAVEWLRLRNDLAGSEQSALLIEPLRREVLALEARRSCPPRQRTHT